MTDTKASKTAALKIAQRNKVAQEGGATSNEMAVALSLSLAMFFLGFGWVYYPARAVTSAAFVNGLLWSGVTFGGALALMYTATWVLNRHARFLSNAVVEDDGLEQADFVQEMPAIRLYQIERESLVDNEGFLHLANNRIVPLPDGVYPSHIDAIEGARLRGKLLTVSERKLHSEAQVSRYTDEAKDMIAFLQRSRLIKAAGNSQYHWTDEGAALFPHSRKMSGGANLGGGSRGTTTATTTHHHLTTTQNGAGGVSS